MIRAVHGLGASLARKCGGIPCDVLDAWFEPSQAAIVAAEASVASLRTSPDINGEILLDAIAKARGISKMNLSLGSGSSEIIHRVLPQLVQNSKVVVLDPSYSEYLVILSRAGAHIDRLKLNPREAFAPDLIGLKRLCRNAQWLVLVNPNNPTGIRLEANDILELASLNPSLKIWVDEAYVDFAPSDTSVEPAVAESDQIFVLKSLSKAYALSGMRVAYLASPLLTAEWIRCTTPPWIISTPSLEAAVAALSDTGYYASQWANSAARLSEFGSHLRSFGLDVHWGHIPAVLIRTPQGARTWATALAEKKIFVRTPEGMGEVLGDDWVRVALPPREDEAQVLTALASVFQQLETKTATN